MKLLKQLSFWFTVHFVFDIISAAVIFAAPEYFMNLIGWTEIDPIATRLVAAALFGIGIESLLGRKSSLQVFRNMLRLKVIWSFSAVAGILLSLIQNAQGRPIAAFILLAVFTAFHILWDVFLIRTGKALRDKAAS